ncbi:MAG: protein translocase subunit SecD [Hyphomicrobiales bacterium]
MLRYSRAKIIGVLLTVVLGLIFVMPNFLPVGAREALKNGFGFLPSGLLPHQSVVLGLDLQGGSHVLLQVDAAAVAKVQITQLREDVRRVLRDQKVGLQGGITMAARGVELRVPDAAERARIMVPLNALGQPVGTTGFGGPRTLEVSQSDDGLIRLNVTDAGITDKVRRAIEQSIEVIRRRVDALGATEPNIQRQGNDRILVEVPGLQDPQRLKDLLGQTAHLEFRFVAEQGAAPGDVEQLPDQETGGMRTVEKRVIVDGADLIEAHLAFDSRTNEPIVDFTFNLRGGQRFGEATAANLGRFLAIVLDNKVISAPRINSAIPGGKGQISGRFTSETANNLAILLRAGALPAPLTIVEERTVGPGLGADSIAAGKLATYVASAFVALFMFAVYGLFGFFANFALLIHVMFIFALMSAFGATLTLPGIAGIVLTIGTAVDSNVLIYERIREEVHNGRALVSALEAGFTRAFATIIDSNATMLIAAVILFLMGSGPVKGFALTMVFGVLTTVITAVTMTRMMIALWYRLRRPQALPF